MIVAVVGVVLRDVACRAGRAARGRPGCARRGTDTSRPGNGTLDQQRRAVRLGFRDQRQVEEVVFRIAFLLPAVDVEVLAEVALAVHQADADERQAEVAGALEMIAGQDAEAAGIDRHALVDAELGREVGDADARRDACRRCRGTRLRR